MCSVAQFIEVHLISWSVNNLIFYSHANLIFEKLNIYPRKFIKINEVNARDMCISTL